MNANITSRLKEGHSGVRDRSLDSSLGSLRIQTSFRTQRVYVPIQIERIFRHPRNFNFIFKFQFEFENFGDSAVIIRNMPTFLEEKSQ